MHNSIVKFNAGDTFHDRKWSGRPRKTTPREDRSMRQIVMRLPKSSRESVLFYSGEREMFYLTTHSTHFIYGYMASDIWLRTILIVRKETRCGHIGYSYRLTARVFDSKFQYCFDTSQQRIWTKSHRPAPNKHLTPVKKRKRRTGLCQTSSPLDSRRVE